MTDRQRVIEEIIRSTYELSLQTTDDAAPALSRHKLTFTTAYALWAIDPDQPPVTMKALAARMHCKPSNLTFICDQLVAQRYIGRTTSPADGRVRVVELTSAGATARGDVVESILANTPIASAHDNTLQTLHQALGSALTQDN